MYLSFTLCYSLLKNNTNKKVGLKKTLKYWEGWGLKGCFVKQNTKCTSMNLNRIKLQHGQESKEAATIQKEMD